jgi:hypothetical protein
MNPSEEGGDGMGFAVELVLTEQSDGWPTDNSPQQLLKKHTKLQMNCSGVRCGLSFIVDLFFCL